MIVEFGGSGVMSGVGYPIFNFEYIVYKAKDDFEPNEKFEFYLTNLLVSIIDDRNNDKDAKVKLDEAASVSGMQSSIIKISKEFYPERYGFYEPKDVDNLRFF
jgi:hypothetical protein